MPIFEAAPKPPAKPSRPKLELVPPETIELSEADLVEEPEEIELSAEEVMEVREPGELQEKDVEPAFEIRGFEGLQVSATLEKKDGRKGNPEDRNQDNILADPETGLLGVMDGVGGERSGDLASKSVEQTLPEAFQQALKVLRGTDPSIVTRLIVEQQLARSGIENPILQGQRRKELTDEVEGFTAHDPDATRKAFALIESLRQANAAVSETGGKTTVCAGFIQRSRDGSRLAVVANVGDSAAFIRKRSGEIIPLTREDSLQNALLDTGGIDRETLWMMRGEPSRKFPLPITLALVRALGQDQAYYNQLRAQGANQFPLSYLDMKRTIVSALGSDVAEPSLSLRKLDLGDELVFATDGVMDKFEDPTTEEMALETLARAMSQGRTLIERMNALRHAAKLRRTYKVDDDIAIVSAKIE